MTNTTTSSKIKWQDVDLYDPQRDLCDMPKPGHSADRVHALQQYLADWRRGHIEGVRCWTYSEPPPDCEEDDTWEPDEISLSPAQIDWTGFPE
jgi:hypothetical protein